MVSSRIFFTEFLNRLKYSGRADNAMVESALRDKDSPLGQIISDKVSWINRSHLVLSHEVLAASENEGGRGVVFFPTDKIDAVHNFDSALQISLKRREAAARGIEGSLLTPENILNWEGAAKESPSSTLVQRIDLRSFVAPSAPRSEVTDTPRDAFAQANGQVVLPQWQDGVSPLAQKPASQPLPRPE